MSVSMDPGQVDGAGDRPRSLTKITKLTSIILDLPPAAAEFSPRHPHLFVVGTYSLHDARGAQAVEEDSDEKVETGEMHSQTRSGSLILFSVDVDGVLKEENVATAPGAVTDIKFNNGEYGDYFAVTCSTGSVLIYKLAATATESPELVMHRKFQIYDEQTLVLSCAWLPKSSTLGITLSTGAVAILDFLSSGEAQEPLSIFKLLHDEDLLAHASRFSSHEAWTMNFGHRGPSTKADGSDGIIYSGGDDSILRGAIFNRENSINDSEDRSVTELRSLAPGGERGIRGHESGVTAILALPYDVEVGKEILVTGSYDEYVRVIAAFDHRPEHAEDPKPKILASLRLGGGVWRLKFMRDYARDHVRPLGVDVRFRILASCMHAGARVIEVVGSLRGEWTISVLGEFAEHKSMNYASDVTPHWDGVSPVKCVSTSFYDRLLAVWMFEDSRENDN